MTRKRQRLYILLAAMLALAGSAALILSSFRENLVFFYTPTEALAKSLAPDAKIRIGGLVEDGTVVKTGDAVTFRITDLKNEIAVSYRGALPDLFREGQGVVAEGSLRDGRFEAVEILAKHDERYMPPEVAAALKKSGRWRGGDQPAEPGPP